MAYARVNGIEHYYEWVCASDAEAPTGKPVMVFLHGWSGSAKYWRSTAAALTDRFDSLLYDMRGFGRSLIAPEAKASTAARGYELDTFADDLAVLLDVLGLDRVYLNSHSVGATVAVFFVNRYGDRVEKAILTCNGVFDYDQKAFEAFYRFGRYVVAIRPQWLAAIPFVPRIFMSRFLHRPIPASEQLAFLKDFLDADYDTALGTIFTAVSKRATEVMPQEFSQIRVPTLLISGEYDQITPAVLGRRAADLNPQITYVELPQTAHFPMLEDATTYLDAVRAFVGMSVS